MRSAVIYLMSVTSDRPEVARLACQPLEAKKLPKSPGSTSIIQLVRWILVAITHPGSVRPACDQHTFHALFDFIEQVNEDKAAHIDEKFLDYAGAHTDLCAYYYSLLNGPAKERGRQLKSFAKHRMYRVLLTCAERAYEGKMPFYARHVIGDMYYRDAYRKRPGNIGHNYDMVHSNQYADETRANTRWAARYVEGLDQEGSEPVSKTELLSKFCAHASPEETGAMLKAAREDALMTQKRVGEIMGVSDGMVRQIELGKGNPSLKTIQRYIDAIRRPVTLQFTPTEPNPSP